jgi:hypothetical protein
MTVSTDPDCNLLTHLCPEDVVLDPFPHLVARNVLTATLARQLTSEYPPEDWVIRANPGVPSRSNKRLDIYAGDVADHPQISPLWKRLIAEQSSARFFHHAVRLFGPALRERYPALAERFGEQLKTARVGLRFRDTYQDHDVLMDAGVSINTPVSAIPTSVREAHLDLPTKLFSGLYYLRPPEDRDTRGGDLQLCRYRVEKSRRFRRYDVDPACVETVETIPYGNNVLVMFLNTIDSLHAVTPRLPTSHTRRFVNLVVEMKQPLFNGAPYQVAPVPFRAKYYIRQLFSWRRA